MEEDARRYMDSPSVGAKSQNTLSCEDMGRTGNELLLFQQANPTSQA